MELPVKEACAAEETELAFWWVAAGSPRRWSSWYAGQQCPHVAAELTAPQLPSTEIQQPRQHGAPPGPPGPNPAPLPGPDLMQDCVHLGLPARHALLSLAR